MTWYEFLTVIAVIAVVLGFFLQREARQRAARHRRQALYAQALRDWKESVDGIAAAFTDFAAKLEPLTQSLNEFGKVWRSHVPDDHTD